MNSADTYNKFEDRRLNGDKGYKTSVWTRFDNETGAYVTHWKSFWRISTVIAPGFNFKVTYHA